MENPLITFLQLLRVIPEDQQWLIIQSFEQRELKEGDCLLQSGDIAKNLFFIAAGVLRIVTTNERGVEATCFFLKENQFCTILNSFNNEVAAPEGIQAACDSVVLVISKTTLLALYKQIPYLKALIDQVMQQTLLDKIQTRNAYLGYDAATRYRLFLTRQPDIALKVPLNDIASYLGITPQSLSRIRKQKR